MIINYLNRKDTEIIINAHTVMFLQYLLISHPQIKQRLLIHHLHSNQPNLNQCLILCCLIIIIN